MERESAQAEDEIFYEETLRQLKYGGGFLSDALNSLGQARFCGEARKIDNLVPIQTYAERLRNYELTQAHADFILEHSDPDKVQRYDAAIQKFNNDIERVKAEKDYHAVQDFVDRVTTIAFEGVVRKAGK